MLAAPAYAAAAGGSPIGGIAAKRTHRRVQWRALQQRALVHGHGANTTKCSGPVVHGAALQHATHDGWEQGGVQALSTCCQTVSAAVLRPVLVLAPPGQSGLDVQCQTRQPSTQETVQLSWWEPVCDPAARELPRHVIELPPVAATAQEQDTGRCAAQHHASRTANVNAVQQAIARIQACRDDISLLRACCARLEAVQPGLGARPEILLAVGAALTQSVRRCESHRLPRRSEQAWYARQDVEGTARLLCAWTLQAQAQAERRCGPGHRTLQPHQAVVLLHALARSVRLTGMAACSPPAVLGPLVQCLQRSVVTETVHGQSGQLQPQPRHLFPAQLVTAAWSLGVLAPRLAACDGTGRGEGGQLLLQALLAWLFRASSPALPHMDPRQGCRLLWALAALHQAASRQCRAVGLATQPPAADGRWWAALEACTLGASGPGQSQAANGGHPGVLRLPLSSLTLCCWAAAHLRCSPAAPAPPGPKAEQRWPSEAWMEALLRGVWAQRDGLAALSRQSLAQLVSGLQRLEYQPAPGLLPALLLATTGRQPQDLQGYRTVQEPQPACHRLATAKPARGHHCPAAPTATTALRLTPQPLRQSTQSHGAAEQDDGRNHAVPVLGAAYGAPLPLSQLVQLLRGMVHLRQQLPSPALHHLCASFQACLDGCSPQQLVAIPAALQQLGLGGLPSSVLYVWLERLHHAAPHLATAQTAHLLELLQGWGVWPGADWLTHVLRVSCNSIPRATAHDLERMVAGLQALGVRVGLESGVAAGGKHLKGLGGWHSAVRARLFKLRLRAPISRVKRVRAGLFALCGVDDNGVLADS